MKIRSTAGSFATPPRAAAAALAVALAFNLPEALALGFGVPQVSSTLGEPLRMRIPLRVDPDIELTSQCVRLLSNAEGDDLPALTMATARLTLEMNSDQPPALRIESASPINEPVLRVTVEAGCLQRVQRQFTLLLDPPEYSPQLASALLPTQAVATQAPANMGTGTPEAPPAVAATPPQPPATAPSPPADLELGNAQIVGRIGQPLSMQIPIFGARSAALDPNCVRLADALSGDGAPVLNQADLSLAHVGTETTLQLVTPQPVTEPAVRVILEVGCEEPMRREYGVLLDTPAAPAPAPLAEAGPGMPPAQPMENPAPPPLAEAGPAMQATAPAPVKPQQRSVHRSNAPTTAPASPTRAATTPASASPTRATTAVAPPPTSALIATSATPPTPAAEQEPAAQIKKPAGAGDHLVLAAVEDQPDAGAARLAEMEKRVDGLRKELRQLRAELDAEKQQRQSDMDAYAHQVQFAWVAAILGVIGVGIGGLLSWQRRTPRKKPEVSRPSWDTIVRTSDRPPATTMPMPMAKPREDLPRSTAMMAQTPEGPVTEPGAGAIPTNAPHTRIEVTELHDSAQSIEQLYTLFHDAGANALPPAAARNTEGLDIDLDASKLDAGASADAAVSDLGAAAQDSHVGAHTTGQAHTQSPTEISLDLDLTTRVVPPPPQEPSPTQVPTEMAPLDLDLTTRSVPPTFHDLDLTPRSVPPATRDLALTTRVVPPPPQEPSHTQVPTEIAPLDLDLTTRSVPPTLHDLDLTPRSVPPATRDLDLSPRPVAPASRDLDRTARSVAPAPRDLNLTPRSAPPTSVDRDEPQTHAPTELSLDLDLTTRIVPPPPAEEPDTQMPATEMALDLDLTTRVVPDSESPANAAVGANNKPVLRTVPTTKAGS